MTGSDVILGSLFVGGILISLTADFLLRRAGTASWSNGCITAAGVILVFVACVAAIR